MPAHRDSPLSFVFIWILSFEACLLFVIYFLEFVVPWLLVTDCRFGRGRKFGVLFQDDNFLNIDDLFGYRTIIAGGSVYTHHAAGVAGEVYLTGGISQIRPDSHRFRIAKCKTSRNGFAAGIYRTGGHDSLGGVAGYRSGGWPYARFDQFGQEFLVLGVGSLDQVADDLLFLLKIDPRLEKFYRPVDVGL